MSEPAFNGVDSLTHLFEAAQYLGNIIGVSVAQTQLTVLVVFSHSVNKALLRNEKSKVVATRDATNLDPLAERHPNRQRVVLTRLDKRPSVGIA